MKCPFYQKKVGTKDWKGIKCNNQTLGSNMGVSYIRPWSEADRENKIKTCCNGDYENCIQYKNTLQID